MSEQVIKDVSQLQVYFIKQRFASNSIKLGIDLLGYTGTVRAPIYVHSQILQLFR